MISKDLITLNDSYDAAHTFQLLTGKQVTLYAFNNSVTYQVFKPVTGYPVGGPTGYEAQADETTAPGTITFPGANGIRLRNASVGLSPAPLCSVRVYDRADVVGQGFTPIGSVISGAGSVTIAQQISYNEFTSNVSITATTEATAQVIVTAASFTADGTSSYLIEFFSPSVLTGAGFLITLVLYEDGASIGQLGEVRPGGTGLGGAFRAGRIRLPVSGSRAYSIRGFVNSGTGTVSAGAGGSGVFVPGYIRITKAT